jgi:hypothetical protein
MVAPKKNPPGDAVGLTPEGSINIGPPEEMKKTFEVGNAESAAAELELREDLDDVSDLEEA